MGISWIHRSELYHLRKMRFLVVAVALSGAAYAQVDVVDPRLTAPYAYGLDTFGGKSAPCVNGANLPVPCAGAPLAYAGYPYAPVAYGKRSADAEPEADAAYFGYGYPYAYAGVPFGSSTGLDPITQGLDAATQGYVPYYGYGHHAYGHYYGKRSADADAEAEAEPEAFSGHYGYPYGLGYNLGYAGYGYAGLPYTYGGIAATNAALGHAVAYTAGGVTHSSNVGVCTNYLGAVVPC